ncbi:hypothetical protein HMPREF0004_1644 [Achromobacter piechaudii ATCC 43553]|uniref:Uncharacterized protein n=1 Tax=Achromobacter piechaudii ATCC 43553 TaxID=742159 RepID=D4X847_9BURK|nr:hypothetical protein HMPREF0004_1644 [Achromobacter piechaudii ATCC 43553]
MAAGGKGGNVGGRQAHGGQGREPREECGCGLLYPAIARKQQQNRVSHDDRYMRLDGAVCAATIASLSLGSSHPLSPKELASTDLVVQCRVAVARTPWR